MHREFGIHVGWTGGLADSCSIDAGQSWVMEGSLSHIRLRALGQDIQLRLSSTWVLVERRVAMGMHVTACLFEEVGLGGKSCSVTAISTAEAMAEEGRLCANRTLGKTTQQTTQHSVA